MNVWVYRPAMAEPPLCSFLECEHMTLDQIADAHELLDLRAASHERAMKNAEARRGRR